MYNKMKEKPCQKVLFILKKRSVYNDETLQGYTLSSGLFNSATFVSNMLNESGIESKVVEVIDANGIDKEVHQNKPTYAIIEAIWAAPKKFAELVKLHPTVKWIVRVHSEIPFLACEGMAFQWIKEYLSYPNVAVSFNSFKTNDQFQNLYPKHKNKIVHLPNYYGLNMNKNTHKKSKTHINIGCFGAIRPMKNQVLQAVAAIEFAQSIHKTLHFHINVGRVESKGDNVLKNLRALFIGTPHKLVEHSWLEHSEFIHLVQKMDVCMQVSMSESFNIVSADVINNEIPLVASDEIEFTFPLFNAKTTSSASMVKKLKLAWWGKNWGLHNLNKIGLYFATLDAKSIWLDYIK